MYASAVKLAEDHIDEILGAAITLIQTAKIQHYGTISRPTLMQGLKPALQMQLRYLENGDITEWKTYCTTVIQERTAQGVDFTNTIKAGQLIVQALTEFFEREIPKAGAINNVSPNEALRSIERRLRGLNMVATSAATSAGLKQTIKNVSNQQ